MIFTNDTETLTDLEKRTCGCWGGGWEERTVREFGITMYTLQYLRWMSSRDYCRSQGTLLSVMWKPGREGSLGENGYMYMHGWVPLLFTGNYHIVNWLYPNTKSQTRLSDFTFTFHCHVLEKEMATHSSVLAWRIPGTGDRVGCRLWCRTESDTTEAT